MGTFQETLVEGTEGALHLAPERPHVYSDLSPEDKERYNADIRATKILLQGMKLNSKFVNNMFPEWGRFITAVKLNRGLWDSNYDQLYAYLKQHEAHANENKMITSSNPRNQATVQDDRVVIQTVHSQQNRGQRSNAWGAGAAAYGGAQNRVGNANPGRQDKAIDEDVDEQPTMFMANLSSADPVYDEAGSSYDSDILSEVHGHDHYQDAICEHHEEHKMHEDVQPTYGVDSHANYTSDSNMIPYDQNVKDNTVPVVQSNVSSVLNDAYMMIFNDMHEPHAQSISDITQNTVVDISLTTKLATYKEQVELYKRQAKFELTKREQKIDEQLRIVITDRNIKEENL
ncbi:hypothetical protein Tco_1125602 [Tanacetum coccineum]|uniref:Uncharacterized protein n=1 Tax=Tanacetum coccineum TaxID=301880 RepID=A0ABQ5J9F2_9ASTR